MSFWRHQVIQPALDRDASATITEQLDILRRDPKDPRAHHALGTLYHLQGQADRALEFFLRAIELDPAWAAPHLSAGRLYAVQGRYQEAWHHAREAARLGDRSLVEQLERYAITKG